MSENKNIGDKAKDIINDVKDESDSFDSREIESGKVMSILAYLGILVLIPYFAEKNNKYVVYHAKEGLNLFIIEVILGVIVSVLGSILYWRLYWIYSIVRTIVGLLGIVLSVIGIVNVCNGKAKELPIINKFKIIK